VPTLDPPVLDHGDEVSSRDEHLAPRRSVVLAAVTFLVAIVATVLVLLAVAAVGA
jgi:hypothetical protein